MDRRQFLRVAAAGAIAAMSEPLFAGQGDFWSRPRRLWLIRNSTKEEIRATYFADGKIVSSEYRKVCLLLRDVQAGSAVQMSTVLLDILRGIQGWFEIHGQHRPIVIHSGYRTEGTNNAIEGAARQSMHLYGRAADLHVPNVPTEYLGRLGLYLRGGGVGFYSDKNFVHVDDGRLRSWGS